MKPQTKKRIIQTMIATVSIIVVLIIATILFINQPQFGSTPSGQRKERVKNSPNYRDGAFQNLSHTPQLAEDINGAALMWDFLFGKHERVTPTDIIPSVDTDLKALNRDEDLIVWFGHSSYLLQTGGRRILVDPVFSKAASPVPFFNKAFKGTDIYKAEDMPDTDYIFISHDHWDHLDYPTIKALKDRTGKIVCSLGAGAHFERWGFTSDRIIELDWNEDAQLEEGFTVSCLPARHFSGRGLSPKQSIWASFMLQTPDKNIYIGGDSGYDSHFAQIGERFGEIELAILENGQYDTGWKYIHMMPEQTLQAAIDLKAKNLLPVHSAKFALANHPWDEPLKRISAAAVESPIRLLTPMIGEVVHLSDSTQVFKEWWTGLE